MKNILLLSLSVAVVLSSCSNKKKLQAEITALESSVDATTDSVQELLAGAYLRFANQHQDDQQANEYRFNSARIYAALEDYRNCVKAVKAGPKKDIHNPYHFEQTKLLAKSYSRLDSDSALMYYEAIADSINLSSFEYHDVARLQLQRFETTDDPDLLLKAGNNFFHAQNFSKSIQAFTKYTSMNNDEETQIKALDRIAFLYSTELNQYDSAEKYYTILAKEFPQSKSGKDAQIQLDNGFYKMSADEILKQFQSKK